MTCRNRKWQLLQHVAIAGPESLRLSANCILEDYIRENCVNYRGSLFELSWRHGPLVKSVIRSSELNNF